MPLHTVIWSTTTSTGAGTEDTLATTTASPSGEAEVQERSKLGGLPRLIGYHGITNDVALAATATGGSYFKIMMNTWETARYIKRPWMAGAMADVTSGALLPQKPVWGDLGALDRDADFDVRVMTTTGNAALAVAVYESYGTPIPWEGPSTVWRLVSAASDNTANVWSTLGTISDLDPRYTYRVNEIIPCNEDKSLLAVRLSSPSNSTYVGALSNQIVAGAGNCLPWSIDFPVDSISVSGVETVTLECLSDAAGEKVSAYVGFRPIGMTSGAVTASGGGLGGVMPGGASFGAGGAGSMISSLFGQFGGR